MFKYTDAYQTSVYCELEKITQVITRKSKILQKSLKKVFMTVYAYLPIFLLFDIFFLLLIRYKDRPSLILDIPKILSQAKVINSTFLFTFKVNLYFSFREVRQFGKRVARV